VKPVFFGRADLDALSARAAESPRRRINRNFHDADSHPAHRLLNAIEPGSYIRPHRHHDAHKEETVVVVRGSFGVVVFDEDGGVSETALMRAGGDLIGAHVPRKTFHTLLALEPGSVFFEVKAGPFIPLTDKDFASWAPPEGDAAVPAYLAKLRALFA
jgi:cupin fold WbuC family metalloprotein